MSDQRGWLQLTISGVNPALAEAALDMAGALAVTLLDAGDELLVEPEPGAGPLWQQTDVVGLFPADTEAAPLQQHLQEALAREGLRIEPKLIEDRDWIRAWMDHYRPMCFGERLWVCPRDQQIDAGEAAVLYLDPGLAFGTGTHPTTALCLEYLASRPPVTEEVMDYGCGSGILAIAAVKLGATAAHYFDIDPQAMKATHSNAESNAAADQLFPMQPNSPGRQVDGVVANILAGPLIELAPRLTAYVRPGGWLALSGLLERQEAEVMAAYENSFRFEPPLRRDGWSCLNARRRTE